MLNIKLKSDKRNVEQMESSKYWSVTISLSFQLSQLSVKDGNDKR